MFVASVDICNKTTAMNMCIKGLNAEVFFVWNSSCLQMIKDMSASR